MTSFRSLAAIGLLGLAAQAHAAPPPGAVDSPQGRFVPFEVLVKFDSEPAAVAAKTQFRDARMAWQRSGLTLVRLDTPTPRLYTAAQMKDETLALLQRLRARSDVKYAQLNYLFAFSHTPNDPLYAQQWHYPLISLPAAWDITRGSSAVRIAILDSGRSGHPELNGKWGPVEYNAPAVGQPATDNGSWRHGTHVAGIAGGASNNGVGGAGVCHNCQLLNAKVGDTTTGISINSIVNGIQWATDNGARVMNMSFEYPSACTQASFPALRDAIARANDHGVSLVAAAGNNAVNVDNVTPASCPGVISVAASDRNNALAGYSSRGPNIGVTAPGGAQFYGAAIGCPADPASGFTPTDFSGAVSAWTTSPGSGNAHCYRHLGGTSMAAPHVAGTIGLMLSANGGLLPEHVRNLIRGTASALPACGTNCGPGLLNAYAAVNASLTATTGPCSTGTTTQSKLCGIDALGHYVNGSGVLVESVYAGGHLWQFDVNGNRIAATKSLRAFPRYATGPCAYAAAGQECRIDTSTVLNYPGFGYLESVTAYGRYWNFDAAGNGLAGNGSTLSSVARFANGPCLYAGGGTCHFDTRNLIYAPEWGLDGLFESITAYGRYWIFDGAGNQIESNTLLSVARFANGPCLYRPAGSVCTFGSRELRRLPSGALLETVTAYGRYFEWDANGNPTANHGLLLRQMARFK